MAALHIADAIPGIHVACVAKQGRGLERDGVRITLQRQNSDGGLIINTLIIAERQGCLSLSAEPGSKLPACCQRRVNGRPDFSHTFQAAGTVAPV